MNLLPVKPVRTKPVNDDSSKNGNPNEVVYKH